MRKSVILFLAMGIALTATAQKNGNKKSATRLSTVGDSVYINNLYTKTSPQDASFTINGKAWVIDGTVDLSTIDTTTTPSVLSTQPQILLAKTITPVSVVSWHGFADNSIWNPTVTNLAYNTYDAFITIGGSQNINHYLGYQFRPFYNGTGTITLLQGYRTSPTINAGTVNNYYGARFTNPNITGTGAIVNNYALYIEPHSGGSGNNYGIYAPGSANNQLIGGNVSMGSGKITVAPVAETDASPQLLTRNTVTGNINTYGKFVSTDGTFGVRSTAYAGDLNTLTKTCIVSISSTATNKPFTNTGILIVGATSASIVNQFAFDRAGAAYAMRYFNGATWTAWTIFSSTAGTSNVFPVTGGNLIAGLKGSATLNFPSTAPQSSADLTVTLSGAADGDVVSLGVPNIANNAASNYSARVSAANIVTVTFNNYSVASIDPASGVFKIVILK